MRQQQQFHLEFEKAPSPSRIQNWSVRVKGTGFKFSGFYTQSEAEQYAKRILGISP